VAMNSLVQDAENEQQSLPTDDKQTKTQGELYERVKL
jgi:hypothetical protein